MKYPNDVSLYELSHFKILVSWLLFYKYHTLNEKSSQFGAFEFLKP